MLDENEKKIWKKFAGNLSTTPSTNLRNNKLGKQQGASKGAWALWTLLKIIFEHKEMLTKTMAITVQKRYPQADLTKWPLITDGPTTDSGSLEIWDAGNATETASHTPSLKKQEKVKTSTQTGQTDTNAHGSTDVSTEILNTLRNTVAGAVAEKSIVNQVLKDNEHLKDANRVLTHSVATLTGEVDTLKRKRAEMDEQINAMKAEQADGDTKMKNMEEAIAGLQEEMKKSKQ